MSYKLRDDAIVHCHVNIGFPSQSYGRDVKMLLRGTSKQIAEQVANDVQSALIGGATKIELTPVPPSEVFDLDRLERRQAREERKS